MTDAERGDPYTPEVGTDAYRVEHYDLDLDYRVARNRLRGTATITAVAREPLRRIDLSLAGLRASSVRVNGRKDTRHAQRGVTLAVTPPEPIPEGARFTVVVEYAGQPAPRRTHWGEVGWEELSDGVLVASQPSGSATWFPCNDRPDDRAAYRIRVAAEAPYTVVCSGRLVSRTEQSGRRSWVYEQPAPTAPYLATVQIGRYRTQSVPAGETAAFLTFPASIEARVRQDFAPVPGMLAFFESVFGPYPFETYHVVVTEDELEIPIEAQAMAVFGANHADGTGAAERLVAHELAHQWFGNSVGVGQWRHIWLNEGLACYAEWLWSEHRGGPSADAIAHGHWSRLARLGQDLAIGDPGAASMFDDRVYKRGALTVHAVRLTLGNAAFFALLQRWTAGHRQGTVSTDDFIAESGLDRDFFLPWLFEARLPRLPKPGSPVLSR
ncbi:M1 family metallopeptidase [Planctomonas deserti]|uniref:M1 family metallopeptidase n=1 Tax=Planctomonas deserti TaxID=2144185 RepID=UPI001F0C0206|nr:M1 family metallopeptidase [Planctomonas deserti]